jgi:hypothetical protein
VTPADWHPDTSMPGDETALAVALRRAGPPELPVHDASSTIALPGVTPLTVDVREVYASA